MINSINKGKTYERAVAQKLSSVFGTKFFRVPQSGATSTTKNLKNFHGDVFTEDESFNKNFDVVVECKKTQNKITLLDYILLNKNKGPLYPWIKQCVGESQQKDFWLIFKWDYAEDIIIPGYWQSSKNSHILGEAMLLQDFLSGKKESGT